MFGKELFEVLGEDKIAPTDLVGFEFVGMNQSLDAPRRKLQDRGNIPAIKDLSEWRADGWLRHRKPPIGAG